MEQTMNPDELAVMGGVFAGFFAVLCAIFVFGILIQVAVCYLLYKDLASIPEEHQKQSPAMVWLLLIPLVNIVWNFFVFPKIAESFKSYFDSVNVLDVDDCGKQLSMYFCYCVVAMVVVSFISNILPILGTLNCLLSPASLVLIIMVLVKFNSLKNRIGQGIEVTPAD
jgi:hypothetical protein